MPRKRRVFCYESPLGPMMERLVREKRASGYKYDTPAWVLKDLDLVEVSLVTYPMQPGARVHAVE